MGIRLQPPPGLEALPNDYPPGVTGGQTLCNQAVAQYPAYRATLLYFYLVMPAVVQDIRKYLVEVFALVRVNLRILKGKIAGKRACWRTNLDNFKL